MTRILFTLLTVSLSVIAGCEDDFPTPLSPELESLTTFDTDLEEWVPLDLGLAPGGSFAVVQEAGAARFDFDTPAAGGEGILAREFMLTPGETYAVLVSFEFGTSDTPDSVEPWRLVVGTSVEGGPWVFNDELTTATPGPVAQTVPVLGDLEVTAGPPDGENDTTSDIRVAIGVRPETSDQRTYSLDRVLVRFVAASDGGAA